MLVSLIVEDFIEFDFWRLTLLTVEQKKGDYGEPIGTSTKKDGGLYFILATNGQ